MRVLPILARTMSPCLLMHAAASVAHPSQGCYANIMAKRALAEVLVCRLHGKRDCECCAGKLLAVALLDCTVKVFFLDSLKFFLSLYGHKLPVSTSCY